MTSSNSSIDIKHIVLKKLDDIRALADMGEKNTYNKDIEREDLSVLFSQISDIAVGLDDHMGELEVSITENTGSVPLPMALAERIDTSDVIKH